MSSSSLVGDDLGKSISWMGILKVKDVETLKESFIDVKLKDLEGIYRYLIDIFCYFVEKL